MKGCFRFKTAEIGPILLRKLSRREVVEKMLPNTGSWKMVMME